MCYNVSNIVLWKSVFRNSGGRRLCRAPRRRKCGELFLAENKRINRDINNIADGAGQPRADERRADSADPRRIKRNIPSDRGANAPRNEGNRPSANAADGRRIKRNVGASMDISDQTPSRRRSAKEAKRIDPDSPEIKRSAKRAKEYKIKKKKKGISRVVLAYLVMFLVMFLAVAGAVSLILHIVLIQTDPPRFERLRLVMCLEHEVDDTSPITVDLGRYLQGDDIYVNMTAISKEFGFIITGDRKQLRFITDAEADESVVFMPGTPFADVNGTAVRLTGDVIEFDGNIFVPANFFEEYVYGVVIEINEDKGILTIFKDTRRNEAGHFVEEKVGFYLKKGGDCPSISEFELSPEIKDKTYFITLSPTIPTE